MAIPSLIKTWQFNVNNYVYGAPTTLPTSRNTLYIVKNGLLGFNSNPWQTVVSCNGTTAGTYGDGIDRWTSINSLNWGATTRSWYVFRQPAISPNFELCIDLNFSTDYYATIVVSPSLGFSKTVGTTSARPTANDEIILSTNDFFGTNLNKNVIINMMQSTDGYCTRLIFCSNSYVTGYWSFERPHLPVSGWATPSASFCNNSNLGSILIIDNLISADNFKGLGTALFNMRYSTIIGTGTNPFPVTTYVSNDISREYPFYPLHLISVDLNNYGALGLIPDMFFGSYQLPHGATYPADGSAQFAQFGSFIFPWDGSNPKLI